MPQGSSFVLLKTPLLVCVAMFSFAFAMAPLYNAYCRATGFNGSTSGKIDASVFKDVDRTRKVKLSFDANIHQGVQAGFSSSCRDVLLHPGEVYTLYYSIENKNSHGVVFQAIPSVTPLVGAKNIRKLECFCFTMQPLEAYEKKLFPLKIMIDPDLPHYVRYLTLSYTLFDKTQQ